MSAYIPFPLGFEVLNDSPFERRFRFTDTAELAAYAKQYMYTGLITTVGNSIFKADGSIVIDSDVTAGNQSAADTTITSRNAFIYTGESGAYHVVKGINAYSIGDGYTAMGVINQSNSQVTFPSSSKNLKEYIEYILNHIAILSSGRAFLDTVIEIRNAPPGSPSTNDRYIVGQSPTGAWASNKADIAVYNGSGWTFTAPVSGDTILNNLDNKNYTYNTTLDNWVITSTNNINNLSTTLDGIVNHTWYTPLNDFVTNTTNYTNKNVYGTIKQYNLAGTLEETLDSTAQADTFVLQEGTGILLTKVTLGTKQGFKIDASANSTWVRTGNTTTNPMLDVNNATESNLTNGAGVWKTTLTLNDVINYMLTPKAIYPTFLVPTITFAIVPTDTSIFSAGYNYVLKGATTTVTLNSTFVSTVGPGSQAYAIQDQDNDDIGGEGGDNAFTLKQGSNTDINTNSGFTSGASVTFNNGNNRNVFSSQTSYTYNPSEQTTFNGNTILSNAYTNYPNNLSNQHISASKTVTQIDPIYYGNATSVSEAWTTNNAKPTLSEVQTRVNGNAQTGIVRYIGAVPTYVDIPAFINTGSDINNFSINNFMVIYLPVGYDITKVEYVEQSYQNITSVAEGRSDTAITYTRPDATTTSYRAVYMNNPYYNSNNPVTYRCYITAV